MLTDAKIRAAKPSDRPVKLFDSGGLYLEVSPAGAAGGASSSASRAEKNGYR
jgi:hypothetical protein